MQNSFDTPVHESSLTEATNVRKEIRQESNDTFNRLHSIAADAEFVSHIARLYPAFKMYANLRCGAWYVQPKIVCSTHAYTFGCTMTGYKGQKDPVYFKSTDGHFGKWAFNLRRVNLHLLDAIMQCGGIILVDSTRHGKRFPDALSKTVPIWCAVINLAVATSLKDLSWTAESREHYGLYTPLGSVSRSEHAQIESCLDRWAEQLMASEYSIPRLPKALRPIWITPDNHTFPPLESLDFFPVICVSASKLLQEGIERRSAGYTYVQGSGDDHESWSQGLTPDLYWHNHAQLLSSCRSTLSTLISSLVASSTFHREITSSSPILTPVTRAKCRLAVGMAKTIPPAPLPNRNAYVAITSQPFLQPIVSSPNILILRIPPGKSGQYKFVTQILPQSLDFLRRHLTLGEDVAVLCDDGKDISVGVAVAALSLFFDDEGVCVVNMQSTGTRTSITELMIQMTYRYTFFSNQKHNPETSAMDLG